MQHQIMEAIEHLASERGNFDFYQLFKEYQLDALSCHYQWLVADPISVKNAMQPSEVDVLFLLAKSILNNELPKNLQLHLFDFDVRCLKQEQVKSED